MQSLTPDPRASEVEVSPHAKTLSWMAALAVAGGDLRTAEGYLVELLSICVLAERTAEHEPD